MGDPSNKAKSIFLDAIEKLAPEQWPAFLDEICVEDPSLRARVERLLHAQGQLGSFHEASSPAMVATAAEPLCERPGTRIGPYKLLEQIGEGGMGLVFVAEQQKPVRRKVALKIIKPGMDTKQVIARFEAERQALAIMDHPNIAKVFDAGSTTRRASVLACSDDAGQPPAAATSEDACATEMGRPYFVMELVKGKPITDYCDRNQLGTRQRLELFSDVCHAVQHAHQKGIIHRDLKPSNILVEVHDVRSVVKIIDFGIAKAIGQQLTDKTLYTGIAQMIGTPLYMSPEQAGLSSLDVDTRSDVYALGVLLYELLTGTTPFDGETLKKVGYDEMRRIVREDEPPKPSARLSTMHHQVLSTIAEQRGMEPRKLSQQMRGELDWIVMKTLEKDRNRRYETASALAADVQRYLQDEPVEACPPSRRYRLGKFLRKHRTGVMTAAAVLMAASVLAGSLGYVVNDQANRLAKIEQQVEVALGGARTAIEAGDLNLARQRVAEAQGQLGSEREHLPAMGADINRVQQQIESRQADEARFNQFVKVANDAYHLGPQLDDGETHEDRMAKVEKALDLWGVLTKNDWLSRLDDSYLTTAQKQQVRETAYVALLYLADYKVRWMGHDPHPQAPQSMKLLERAQAFHEPTRAFYYMRSECHRIQGNTAAGDEDVKRFKATVAQTAWDYFLPGHTAGWRGDVKEAIRSYQAALRLQPNHYPSLLFLAKIFSSDTTNRLPEAIQLWTALSALEPDDLAYCLNRGICYGKLGQFEQAETELTVAIAKGNATLGPDAHDTLKCMNILAKVFGLAGRLQEAIALHEQTLEKSRSKLGADHPDTLNFMNELAHDYGQAGRQQEAIALHEQTLEKRKTKLGPDHPDTLLSMNNLAVAYSQAGRIEEAITLHEQAVEKRKIKLGPDHPDTLDSMQDLGYAYWLAGRLKDAITVDEQTLEKRKAKLGLDHPDTLISMSNLAVSYTDAAKHDQAERLYQNLLEYTVKKGGPKTLDTAGVLALLGLNHLKQERYVEAEPLLRECLTIRENQLPDDWLRFNTLSMLGDALQGQKKYTAAEPLLLKGYEGMKQREAKIPSKGKIRLTEGIERIVHLYEATEQKEKARTWREKLPAGKSPMGEEKRDQSQDTDFNGVRRADALAKLPEAERREWRKLWEEVEELRKRAGEKPLVNRLGALAP